MDDAAWTSLYRLLSSLGLPRPTLSFELVGKKDRLVLPLAWPEIKVGLLIDDTPPPWAAKLGWRLTPLRPRTIEALAPLLSSLDSLRMSYLLARSGADAQTTTSKTEERMLAALAHAGLPLPNRNLHVYDEDGSLLTIPDFAWETYQGREVKVVLEVDGFFWHGGQDLRNEILRFAASDPALADQVQADARSRAEKDAYKRRILNLRGWSVVLTTDTEVDAPDGPATVAAQVKALILSRAGL